MNDEKKKVMGVQEEEERLALANEIKQG